jgi:hypothetical protein
LDEEDFELDVNWLMSVLSYLATKNDGELIIPKSEIDEIPYAYSVSIYEDNYMVHAERMDIKDNINGE